MIKVYLEAAQISLADEGSDVGGVVNVASVAVYLGSVTCGLRSSRWPVPERAMAWTVIITAAALLVRINSG